MDLKETNAMGAEEEKRHWWIRTRFQYIDMALSHLHSQEVKVAEYGCGTGQNLWYLRQESSYGDRVKQLTGIDLNLPENFKLEWQKPSDTFSNQLNTDVKDSDLILAMDVLEHIDEDVEALKMWVSNLSDDGVILITVPAFSMLWSHHDDYLDHKRRYTRESLLEVARQAGLEPLKLTYAFSFLFLPVLVIRKLLPRGNKASASDLKLPSFLINQAMIWLGKIEYLLGGFSLFGTSVVGIFKKR